MKIVACFLTSVILLTVSCCKEDLVNSKKITVPIGSIVAQIDGIETTFNIEPNANFDTIPWSYGQTALKLSISAKNGITDNSKNILIWFFVVPIKQIDEGKYPDLNKQIYHYLEFNNLWRGNLYNYGSNRYVDEFYSSTSTIFKIDSLVQGVFSGNVGIGVGPGGQEQPPLYHKITNGQFNIRLKN